MNKYYEYKVCLNLQESSFLSQVNGINYYFSSQFNLDRFNDRYLVYATYEKAKFDKKYNTDTDINIFIHLFYKQIEKRGYRVELEKNGYKYTLGNSEFNLKFERL